MWNTCVCDSTHPSTVLCSLSSALLDCDSRDACSSSRAICPSGVGEGAVWSVRGREEDVGAEEEGGGVEEEGGVGVGVGLVGVGGVGEESVGGVGDMVEGGASLLQSPPIALHSGELESWRVEEERRG